MFNVSLPSLADLRGHQGRAPGVQTLLFSCNFRQKYLQNNTTLGVGVPLRKILDLRLTINVVLSSGSSLCVVI